MSSSSSGLSIEPNTIYIGLTNRYPIGEDRELYHWLLYFNDSENVGTCVHVTNAGGGFQFQEKPWRAATSQSLAALVSIGKFQDQDFKGIIELLKQIPIESPKDDEKEQFNCRIWIRQAVRVLSNKGILTCDNINGLEKEAIGFANENRESVELGGKAEVYKSSFSK